MTERVVLLAADTTRSSAYAQVLHDRGPAPDHVIVYGGGDTPRLGQGVPTARLAPEVGLPDVDTSVGVVDVVRTAGWSVEVLADVGVNDEPTVAVTRDLAADLLVFSGYGGELVRHEMLALAPVLHVHAGRLPTYRGSTTTYYSLLVEGTAEVSAILLEPSLDTGTIVGRRTHPAPPRGTDIDHTFDPAMRADLLASVLTHRRRTGTWPEHTPQPQGEERLHYIIHPVLKHVTLLGLPAPAS